jgi:hypothetical protein
MLYAFAGESCFSCSVICGLRVIYCCADAVTAAAREGKLQGTSPVICSGIVFIGSSLTMERPAGKGLRANSRTAGMADLAVTAHIAPVTQA